MIIKNINYLLFFLFLLAGCTQQHYSVVIDAGSTGSRAYIYKEISSSNQIPNFQMISNCRIGESECLSKVRDQGMSKLPSDINQASMDNYLKPLLDFAKSKVGQANLTNTPIYLRATAGMRNVPLAREKYLMNMASRTLATSGFLSKGAATISGSFEGMYTWTVVNQIKGTLGKDPLNTYGIIEIGGASVQVTFVPETQGNIPPIKIGGMRYPLYTYSYNRLGVGERLRTTSREPSMFACRYHNSGTVDYQSCKDAWTRRLNQNQFCKPLCGMQGVSQPPVRGKFYMLGGPTETIANHCGVKTISSVDIDRKGQEYCMASPEEQKKICTDLPEYKYSQLCEIFILVSTQLSQLGFAADTKNIVTPLLGDITDTNGKTQKVNWTRGFLIFEKLGLNPS